MKEKLIQLKEKFLSLSNVKKVMIISGSAVVLLGGGYAVSVLAGQAEKTQEVVQVAEVTTETTTTTENKELKDLQEKVAKASSEALKKEDKETLEKSIKDSKLSDKEKEDLIKNLEKVTLVEQTTSSEKKRKLLLKKTKQKTSLQNLMLSQVINLQMIILQVHLQIAVQVRTVKITVLVAILLHKTTAIKNNQHNQHIRLNQHQYKLKHQLLYA